MSGLKRHALGFSDLRCFTYTYWTISRFKQNKSQHWVTGKEKGGQSAQNCKQVLHSERPGKYTEHVSYLIRLRVLGVTDAVGEEDRESCGDVVPIAMREAGDAPSDADMSRFISSLLRRDTVTNIVEYKLVQPLCNSIWRYRPKLNLTPICPNQRIMEELVPHVDCSTIHISWVMEPS